MILLKCRCSFCYINKNWIGTKYTQNSAKCLEVLEFSARNVGPNV